MKLLIAAGGTGGHLFPGIALAQLAKAQGWDVEFVGSKRGLEKEIIQRYGFPHTGLSVGRLKGESIFTKLKTALSLPASFFEALNVLKAKKPTVIFGIGGYSSGPMLVAATALSIPRLILEPNSIPGLTNKWLGFFANRICLMFPETERFFPKQKVVVTGTPVREEISKLQKKSHEKFTIAIIGGSQGARPLNEAMVAALPALDKMGGFHIIHQTGQSDYENVKKSYESFKNITCEVKAFIQDMMAVYQQVDLVVSRSGASTVAELIEARIPSILVPYPFAADDHQRWNAQSVVRQDGAEMILNDELKSQLIERILYYQKNRGALERMSEALQKMRLKPATETVFEEVKRLS